MLVKPGFIPQQENVQKNVGFWDICALLTHGTQINDNR